MNTVNPRKKAVELLLRVENDGSYSQIVLNNAIKDNDKSISAQDRAFLTALFYGTLSRQITLDHIINTLCKHKLSKKLRILLRTAFYQLLYMDTVPDSAAVNETVKLARSMKTGGEGLTNAVLRAFIRNGKQTTLPSTLTERLSVEYSCPVELVDSLVKWYGEETAIDILKHTLTPPTTYIRVNTAKTTVEKLIQALNSQGVMVEKTTLEGCLKHVSGRLIDSIQHRDGHFHVQDIHSQQAAVALSPHDSERVLDLCAAPGSKSFLMSQLLGEGGEVVAADISESRLSLVEEGIKRLGLKNVTVKRGDATVFDSSLGMFEAILCDLPCSGLGVINRKPEIKYKPMNFDELCGLQYKILKNASQYLRQGGRMVYSTCTINPDENDGVLDRFLNSHLEFSVVSRKQYLPGDGGSGFYVAVLTKK